MQSNTRQSNMIQPKSIEYNEKPSPKQYATLPQDHEMPQRHETTEPETTETKAPIEFQYNAALHSLRVQGSDQLVQQNSKYNATIQHDGQIAERFGMHKERLKCARNTIQGFRRLRLKHTEQGN